MASSRARSSALRAAPAWSAENATRILARASAVAGIAAGGPLDARIARGGRRGGGARTARVGVQAGRVVSRIGGRDGASDLATEHAPGNLGDALDREAELFEDRAGG